MPDVWVEAYADDGKKRMSFRESNLKNSLDAIILKTEGKPKKLKTYHMNTRPRLAR